MEKNAPSASAVPAELQLPNWVNTGHLERKATQSPNRIHLGASVKLWSIEGVAEDLGVTVEAATGILDALKVPTVALPGSTKRYANLYALESALFALSLPTSMTHLPDGTQDRELLRLHQELAGAMYMASSAEMIRRRVKNMAEAMGFGVKRGRKPKSEKTPLTEKSEKGTIHYKPVVGG